MFGQLRSFNLVRDALTGMFFREKKKNNTAIR